MKLPRRFGSFDYRIPDGSSFCVGDVIHIPFRNRMIFGVIEELRDSTRESRVLSVPEQSPLFSMSQLHIHHLRTVASEIGQSMSSILSVAYEGLLSYATAVPPRNQQRAASQTIQKDTIATVRDILQTIKTLPFSTHAADDETVAVLAHALATSTHGQLLILVSRERDAQFYRALLHAFDPLILTGKVKSSERNAALRAWKRGDRRVLIGTRQAVLIEPHALETILVIHAACDDHTSTRRNPHIDAVHVATSLAATYSARIVLTDSLPPVTLHVQTVSNDTARMTTREHEPTAQIIDVCNRGESSGLPLLSQTLLEAIKSALHSEKKVLLFLNRKGVAKRLECKECGHVPFCGTCGSLPTVRQEDLLCEACGTEMWIPKLCPACGSTKVGPRLIGGTRIINDLTKAFPDVSVGRIEKGRTDIHAQIIVATEFFWSSVAIPFHKFGFGLIAELLADVGFAPGDYRGAEKTARKIQRLQNFAKRERAACVIQTVARDRLLSLLGAEHVQTQELAMRQKYLLPPFGVIITFEHATLDTLPNIFLPNMTERNGVLTAKISETVFHQWLQYFPEIPDHINIRIQR